MKKAIPITILILGAIIGGVFYAANQGDEIQQTKLDKVVFEEEDINLTKSNIEIMTETEVIDGVTTTKKVGVRVPITYLFPVASGTDYIAQEMTEYVSVNFDGYNNCRAGMFGTSTKSFCVKFVKKQLEGKIEAKQDSIRGRLEELKKQSFEEELIDDDF